MANGQDDHRPHFILGGTGESRPFTSPKTGRSSGPVPPQNRHTHAAFLREQLAAAAPADADAPTRLQLEFQSYAGIELATQSLARDQSGIELLNVRTEGNITRATISVPSGKLNHFEKLIGEYLAEKTNKKGQRIDRQKLIDAIQQIRKATVRALWTDEIDLLPVTLETVIAWEVWLPVRDQGEVLLADFREHAQAVGWQVSERAIRFPERTVLVCIGTQAQLESSANLLGLIAELRRAKETADFFDELTPLEQQQWVEDLLGRAQMASPNAPFVCLLDTGVNRGHPLLEASLAVADQHTVTPAWGVNDSHGHGTQLAGVALFGDLTEALAGDGPLPIPLRLESVKLLEKPGDNENEPYGAITQESVARVEIQAPDRLRVFNLAVTATDTRDRGRPSSWSAELDSLAFDAASDGARPRLFVVASGNCKDEQAWLTHPTHLQTESIHDPAQSWNALTVGACTDKVHINEVDAAHYQPIASAGSLSPYTSTSVTWVRKGAPWKPDVVFEGGNVGRDGNFPSSFASLSLLTTHHLPQQRLFATSHATSASTAQVARMAAQISANYPQLWPETLRGLIVHSARWTDRMREEFDIGANDTLRRTSLLRHCGYGVPSLTRALWSASDSLTLIVQDEMQPFEKTKKGIRSRDMRLHNLPWPRDALLGLGGLLVKLRVTLSYFIEPNPGERGAADQYAYHSHALRFEVRRPGESTKAFLGRINRVARDEEYGTHTAIPDSHWTIGDTLRRRGSLHSDVWSGTAAELADRGILAVYPAIGWWRRRTRLLRYDRLARYALIVSIEAPEAPLDLYAVLEQQIAVPIPA
jgi:Subtilase family